MESPGIDFDHKTDGFARARAGLKNDLLVCTLIERDRGLRFLVDV